MRERRKSRSFRFLAVLVMVCVLVSTLPPVNVGATVTNTSGSFDQRISQLKAKFPNRKYWNHMGSSANNPNGYTSTPCTHHRSGYCSSKGYNGWCGCNSFNNQSIQCFGFAEKLAYDVFGTNPSRTWTKSYSLNNVKKGDIIRYKNNGHSIFVTNVSGNTITYADCNSDGHCLIRWDVTIAKSAVTGFNYVQHANNYSEIMNISSDTQPPTVTNMRISEVRSNGYVVTATVTDNVGIASVTCATWTERNGQDDLLWTPMTMNGNTASVFIPYDKHGNSMDTYNNHIHTYDTSGNRTITIQNYVRGENKGTNFYAKLKNVQSGKYVTNKNENVVSASAATVPEQVWKFERQSDNSYKIISCLDGKVLDVDHGKGDNGTNVGVFASNNGSNQRWFFCKNATGYNLVPANATASALDCYGNSHADGANMVLWQIGNADAAEVFTLENVTNLNNYQPRITYLKCYANNNPSQICSQYTEGDTVHFKIVSERTSEFQIRLYKNNALLATTDRTALSERSGGQYFYRTLTAGNYRLEVTPKNYLGHGVNTAATAFTIRKKENVQQQNPVVTPSTDQNKKTDNNVTNATVTKPDNTAKTDTVTQIAKVGKVSAAAVSSSAVRLNWNSVKGAEGYQIYRYNKITKKYSRIATVKGTTTYTNKKLSAVTSYQYKVRAYGKISGRTKYGAYSDVVTTATKTKTVSILMNLSLKKGQAFLSWKKVKGCNGYEVYRSTLKNGSYQKIADIKSNKLLVTYTNKNLQKKTTYYYKVRGYQNVNGSKIYGDYSTAKKVKTR